MTESTNIIDEVITYIKERDDAIYAQREIDDKHKIKEKALQQAIKMKHINIVKDILNDYDYSDFNTFNLAIYINDKDTVIWMLDKSKIIIDKDNIDEILKYACLTDNMKIINSMHIHSDSFKTSFKICDVKVCLEILAYEGHADAIKQFISKFECNDYIENTSRIAASRGHLEVIQNLRFRYNKIYTIENIILDIKTAITAGHLNIVKWFMKQRDINYDKHNDILTYAIIHNQLDIVKWFIEDFMNINYKEYLTRNDDQQQQEIIKYKKISNLDNDYYIMFNIDYDIALKLAVNNDCLNNIEYLYAQQQNYLKRYNNLGYK